MEKGLEKLSKSDLIALLTQAQVMIDAQKTKENALLARIAEQPIKNNIIHVGFEIISRQTM